jgi:HAE1 family hydrophobic/amphiphilic exporter-1
VRTAFFPTLDSGQITIAVESSPGARLEYTDHILRQIEERLSDQTRYPEIEDLTVIAGQLSSGGLGAGNTGGQYGNLQIYMTGRERLARGERVDRELAADLRRDLADLPGVDLKINAGGGMGGGAEAPLQVQVLGNDLNEINAKAQEIARQMRELEGLRYVDTSTKPGRPEARVYPDRERLAEYGLTIAEVAGNLRTAFAGSTTTKYRTGGAEYDIRVQLSEEDTEQIADIGNAVVGTSSEGEAVRVRDIGEVTMAAGPSLIERANQQRYVAVSAYNDPEVLDSGKAQELITEIINNTDMGMTTWDWAGEARWMRESFMEMFKALALAIILVYLVTAALYNGLLEPFNIMLNLPVAVVGALVGLIIANMELSLVSMIGIIMLMGIVGKNSILMVDYANTLRARGLARYEALLEAGPTRMKPILMTTLTAVAAMIPTAIAWTEGSEFRAPLGVTIIFGLALATLISLVLVPATYVIWDSLADGITNLARRLMHIRAAQPSAPEEDEE